MTKVEKPQGERLFHALRELEIPFLNGGRSVQTSAQKLLKSKDFAYPGEMTKYLIDQSIIKKDEENSTHKKPYYWYNGPKLSVKYCNDLILQMKLSRAVDSKEVPGTAAKIEITEPPKIKDMILSEMADEAFKEMIELQDRLKEITAVWKWLKKRENEN